MVSRLSLPITFVYVYLIFTLVSVLVTLSIIPCQLTAFRRGHFLGQHGVMFVATFCGGSDQEVGGVKVSHY